MFSALLEYALVNYASRSDAQRLQRKKVQKQWEIDHCQFEPEHMEEHPHGGAAPPPHPPPGSPGHHPFHILLQIECGSVLGLSTQNTCMSSVPFSNYYGTEGEGEGGDGPLRLLKRTMNLNTNVYQFLVAGKVSFSRGCSSIVP